MAALYSSGERGELHARTLCLLLDPKNFSLSRGACYIYWWTAPSSDPPQCRRPPSDDTLASASVIAARATARSAQNAKSPLERHLSAFYFWEAGLKLLGSAAIVDYAALDRSNPTLMEVLKNLGRPCDSGTFEGSARPATDRFPDVTPSFHALPHNSPSSNNLCAMSNAQDIHRSISNLE